MRSLSFATRKRRWRWQGNSCNFTWITWLAGKERAKFVRLPVLEASARRMDQAAMTDADIHHAILAAWRIEQPRLITGLSRMLRDVPLAEELTQDALVAALEHWPATGIPENPGAWLM